MEATRVGGGLLPSHHVAEVGAFLLGERADIGRLGVVEGEEEGGAGGDAAGAAVLAAAAEDHESIEAELGGDGLNAEEVEFGFAVEEPRGLVERIEGIGGAGERAGLATGGLPLGIAEGLANDGDGAHLGVGVAATGGVHGDGLIDGVAIGGGLGAAGIVGGFGERDQGGLAAEDAPLGTDGNSGETQSAQTVRDTIVEPRGGECCSLRGDLGVPVLGGFIAGGGGDIDVEAGFDEARIEVEAGAIDQSGADGSSGRNEGGGAVLANAGFAGEDGDDAAIAGQQGGVFEGKGAGGDVDGGVGESDPGGIGATHPVGRRGEGGGGGRLSSCGEGQQRAGGKREESAGEPGRGA